MARARACGRCELGFANARGGGCGFGGFKGVAGCCFYRGGARPWRAGPREHGGAEISVGFDRDSGSPAQTGKQEDPDERGPPGGETGRGGGRWAGSGERAGRETGRGKVFWAAVREKKGSGGPGWK